MSRHHPLLSGYVFHCLHRPSTTVRLRVSVSTHHPLLSDYVFQCPHTIYYCQATCFSVHTPSTIVRLRVSVSTHHPLLSGYVCHCLHRPSTTTRLRVSVSTHHYYQATCFSVHTPSTTVRLRVSVSTHHLLLSGYVFHCPHTIFRLEKFVTSSVNSFKAFFKIIFSVFIKMQQQ